jgi:hypothetical protein
MRRRELIAGLGGAVACPLVARARQAVQVIGFLHARTHGPMWCPLVDLQRLSCCLLYLCCWTSGTAYAQRSVSIQDLQGAVIHAQVFYQAEGLNNGRPFKGQHRDEITVTIVSPSTLSVTQVSIAISNTGQSLRSSPQMGGTIVLGKPEGRAGVRGGHSVWTYQDGKLIKLETRDKGGFKLEIAFSRSRDGGLQCAIRTIYLRETGVAGWHWRSPIWGTDMLINSMKSTSSSCQVTNR